MTVYGGDVIYAADLNALPRGLIAKHIRTATALSGIGSTETGFVRLDGIAVRSGYTYEITAARCILTTSATTTTGLARMRGSTSGSATTSSTQLDGAEARPAVAVDTSNVPEQPMIGYWSAGADGTLSVIVTIQRAAGAGTVGLYSASTTGVPFTVKEIGLTPTDGGTDL